jgi:hypothetical protein
MKVPVAATPKQAQGLAANGLSGVWSVMKDPQGLSQYAF